MILIIWLWLVIVLLCYVALLWDMCKDDTDSAIGPVIVLAIFTLALRIMK